MFFILGLFLTAAGIGLALVTQTVTLYGSFYDMEFPYRAIIYPYQGLGVFLFLSGIIILVVAFVKTKRRS